MTKKLLQEVIAIFRDEVPRHMVSLRQAITECDAEGIERAAHILRGKLGYVGTSDVSQKAREMEEFGHTSAFGSAAALFTTFEAAVSEVLVAMRKTVGPAASHSSPNV